MTSVAWPRNGANCRWVTDGLSVKKRGRKGDILAVRLDSHFYALISLSFLFNILSHTSWTYDDVKAECCDQGNLPVGAGDLCFKSTGVGRVVYWRYPPPSVYLKIHIGIRRH